MPGNSNKFSRLSAVNGRPVGRRYAKIDDAAEYLDVKPCTIRQLMADGKINAYRSGQRIVRVDLNEIDALMADDGQRLTGTVIPPEQYELMREKSAAVRQAKAAARKAADAAEGATA